jgi:hypothetical protein
MDGLGIHKLREEIHHRQLSLRKIETQIFDPQFDRLWADSSDDEKKAFSELVDSCDYRGVRDWIQGHKSLSLGEKTVKELRKIGRRLHIKNWSRLNRFDLIRAIQSEEQCSVNASTGSGTSC